MGRGEDLSFIPLTFIRCSQCTWHCYIWGFTDEKDSPCPRGAHILGEKIFSKQIRKYLPSCQCDMCNNAEWMNEGGICSALGMGGGQRMGGGGRRERKKEQGEREGERKWGMGGLTLCMWERDREGGRREDVFKRFRIRERLLDLEDPGDLPSREGGEGHPGWWNSLNAHWEWAIHDWPVTKLALHIGWWRTTGKGIPGHTKFEP